MRETVMAFSPLAAAVYFTVFPNQFTAMVIYIRHLMY
jgi:hypothetical protein